MALTVNQVGRIDLPAQLAGGTGAPADLDAFVLDVTLGVSGDYATGITYASLITAINAAATASPPTISTAVQVTQIVTCTITHVFRSGTGYRFGFTVNDNSTGTNSPPNRVRYFVLLTTETAGTEYATTAGDVFRMVITAI